MKEGSVLAWHFLGDDWRPTRGRRRRNPLTVGSTMRHRGPVALCESGLHASRRLLDALRYAEGDVVCWVEIGGTIVEGDDKLAGTRRTILAGADISRLLREWACDVAEGLLRDAGVRDERSWAAIEVARRYARGEATDEELVAARAAAWTAAWAAAWIAASAARAAARAASDAASDAAKAAARAAAGDAAWPAAWAARDRLNADLEARVRAELGLEVPR